MTSESKHEKPSRLVVIKNLPKARPKLQAFVLCNTDPSKNTKATSLVMVERNGPWYLKVFA